MPQRPVHVINDKSNRVAHCIVRVLQEFLQERCQTIAIELLRQPVVQVDFHPFHKNNVTTAKLLLLFLVLLTVDWEKRWLFSYQQQNHKGCKSHVITTRKMVQQ